MKFYIASSFANVQKVREFSDELKLKGFVHTYDWTQNERANSLEDLSIIGEDEKKAVIDSDFLVVLLPAGKGSHIELGIALGAGKKVYLYSPTNEIYEYDRTSTFYHIESVDKFVGTFDSFKKYLTEREEKLKLKRMDIV